MRDVRKQIYSYSKVVSVDCHSTGTFALEKTFSRKDFVAKLVKAHDC